MSQAKVVQRFPTVAEGNTHAPGDTFYKEEIQLALRNRGMPLEGLRYPITPTGMHYLLPVRLAGSLNPSWITWRWPG